MNAIYHARRALAIDPGNGEMRDVLARAQAGKSTPPTSAVRSNPVQPSDYGGTDVETPPPAPIAGSADKPFAGVVRDEIKAGDAYMKAGNYDMALRKFLTAAVLDPGNEDVNDRIARARQAKEATEDNGSDSAAESGSAP